MKKRLLINYIIEMKKKNKNFVFSGAIIDRYGDANGYSVSGMRTLRDMRENGEIKYEVVDYRKSQYRITSTITELKKLLK